MLQFDLACFAFSTSLLRIDRVSLEKSSETLKGVALSLKPCDMMKVLSL